MVDIIMQYPISCPTSHSSSEDIQSLFLDLSRYLCLENVFTDVNKDPEMGKLSWIIQVRPQCHPKCPYKRKAKGE